eukprot:TRINITY_DN18797_c1_g1_i1.p1 TRINITY_DN18797_c1_g1~~TRINITY_DN18797_c1_g1_i1.p1  ORF type:complete len:205 (-),score=10.86 TRINITY_DN18797_c1_g1_i1:180-794(-)
MAQRAEHQCTGSNDSVSTRLQALRQRGEVILRQSGFPDKRDNDKKQGMPKGYSRHAATYDMRAVPGVSVRPHLPSSARPGAAARYAQAEATIDSQSRSSSSADPVGDFAAHAQDVTTRRSMGMQARSSSSGDPVATTQNLLNRPLPYVPRETVNPNGPRATTTYGGGTFQRNADSEVLYFSSPQHALEELDRLFPSPSDEIHSI